MEYLAPEAAILALFLGLLAPARPKHEAMTTEITTAHAICIRITPLFDPLFFNMIFLKSLAFTQYHFLITSIAFSPMHCGTPDLCGGWYSFGPQATAHVFIQEGAFVW